MDDIIEIENFIPKKYCDYVISYFSNVANNEIEKINIWNTTFVYDISGDSDFNDPIIKEITNMIEETVINYILKDLNIVTDYFQIVFWDKGSYQHAHLDTWYQNYTAILYLNEDFNGGETILETGKIIKPKVGKLVGFPGNRVKHKVNKILNGQRYTMPVWFCPKEYEYEKYTNRIP